MATAQDVLGMTGVRNELINRGISNDRIGWNQTTGTVTIDGQDFLKPTTIIKTEHTRTPPGLTMHSMSLIRHNVNGQQRQTSWMRSTRRQ